ncbi:uncharacterized protein LACBIDRAFT_295922 [Laccaria bicolor S238N-H82]|uniref:Predicted protein n=1 Tax=Laccaria bicolor (strain S238N-H82 / ATCC MYA-4686) TaxID=486041 RepID=B0E0B3_LACBS|nr:uncharacterized protein LACBIDRAFT_295922 [Laccaria bicolor S238N-H82]EDQ99692.1 predicted protein [Laccaria bicolor S238N-H82]|eukprot:XP_001889669.1 predicted protein [Laccaria bicolor S238N-H82]
MYLPSQMVTELPVEIWLHIVGFIPADDRRKLVGVNRVFFELIMDELYGQLNFVNSNPWELIETLMSLQVRVLKIWPGALCDAIHTMKALKKPLQIQRHKPDAPDPHTRPPGSLSLLVNKVFKKRPTPTDTSLPSPPDVLPPPDKRKELFFDAISRLHRVHELRMYYHEEHGRSFLHDYTTGIWSVHGRNIRRLVIEIPFDNAMAIIPRTGVLEILEELELILRCNPSDASAKDTLCAFVNGLAPTLHSLSLRFVNHSPLSLIESLESFPRIKKLSIPMPLNEYHRPDHSRLRRFLSKNDTLRDLHISYPSCCSPHAWRMPPLFHQIQVTVSCPDTTLPELCSLELSLRSPALISREAIDLFAGLSQNLTSLTLTSRTFSVSTIDTILLSFENHKLKELSLFSEHLSAELMDTFVRRCPELIKLVLEIEDVELKFISAMAERRDLEDLRKPYKDWTLQDLSILQWVYGHGRGHNWACMRAVADVAPTIRSFAGQGNMEEASLRGLRPQLVIDLQQRPSAWQN